MGLVVCAGMDGYAGVVGVGGSDRGQCPRLNGVDARGGCFGGAGMGMVWRGKS